MHGCHTDEENIVAKHKLNETKPSARIAMHNELGENCVGLEFGLHMPLHVAGLTEMFWKSARYDLLLKENHC